MINLIDNAINNTFSLSFVAIVTISHLYKSIANWSSPKNRKECERQAILQRIAVVAVPTLSFSLTSRSPVSFTVINALSACALNATWLVYPPKTFIDGLQKWVEEGDVDESRQEAMEEMMYRYYIQSNELHLDKMGLKTAPKEIGMMTRVQHCYLRENKLQSLPPEIVQMKNLRELFLENNGLETFPTEVLELPNLFTLNLKNNAISGELTADIGRMVKLRTLLLEGNEITSLPQNIANLNKYLICDFTVAPGPINWMDQEGKEPVDD